MDKDNRLVSVSPKIKAHRLWSGSMMEGNFYYGGVTIKHVKELVERLSRCSDLTASEVTWLALWREVLQEQGV